MTSEESCFGCAGILFILLLPILFFTSWESSEQIVSGVVYNNKNNALIGGKTTFGVRASVDTVVNESTASTYCLPKGSEYIPLVKEAAENKDIKVKVTTSKYFAFIAPWNCASNVKVEKVN